MIRASFYRKTCILFALFTVISVRSEIEICTDGGEHVFQVTQESCPFGVLFLEPQSSDCLLTSGEDESAILADVCTKEPYTPERKQFQFIPEISPDAIDPINSCKGAFPSICTAPIHQLHQDSFLRRIKKADIIFESETTDKNKLAVGEQTRRLFEYTLGLSRVYVDETLRIILLFKKSIEIVKKFCSGKYLPVGFSEDVESSFLFLFNEADRTKIQDVSIEDFEMIMEHLIYCADQRNPLKFQGRQCPTYGMIQSVNKSGEVFSNSDIEYENVFMDFDVPVEAAWRSVDFVHGLCYGTFKSNINSHHLYQQAMERLFTREIAYRWKNRFVFADNQRIWNHFYSANVKLALANLNMCVQAGYLSTPFPHGLDRSFRDRKAEEHASAIAPAPSSRKKRWTEAHALKSIEAVEGYCFQTKEEADAALANACK